MTSRTITDIAYECMKRKRKEVPFNKLWQEVYQLAGYDETLAKKKIAQFYNAITLDARFISLPDNKWDLKARHTFNETRIDTSQLILDEDLDDFDDEDSLRSEDEESDEEKSESEEY